jgi:multidrug efflux pump subunit AcrB
MAMLTGVLCIYIVLVLLFKDFMHPISILPAVPLSFGGAFMGCWSAARCCPCHRSSA